MNGGYFPEAVTNFLCNVGWNYGVKDDQGVEVQIFSKEDAAKIFDITRMSVSGTKFDVVKLQWLNGEYVRQMEPLKLAQQLRPYLEAAGLEVNVDTLLKIIPLVRERIKVLPDVVKVAAFFFRDDVTPDPVESLIPKKMDAARTRNALKASHDALLTLPAWDHAHMEGALRPLADKLSLSASQLFTALRVATTGQTVSPPLFETLEVIGKEVSLKRIAAAIGLLEKQTA
jgi:glutamyl-tRNA synthetase